MNTIEEKQLNSSAQSDRQGFSLVEVVVAGFLMVVGFLALSRLIIGMMSAADLSRHTMEATSLAQGKIENIITSGYDAASSGSETVDGYYTLNWTSSVSSVSSVKDVAVTTEWTDRHGEKHDVDLNTMLAKRRTRTGNLSFTNIPVLMP